MDIMELGAIGELVGRAAVIASLIFVGAQIRHINRLAQGAAEIRNGRMVMDYLRMGARRARLRPEARGSDGMERSVK